MITWKPDWKDGRYWSAYNETQFIGAVYSDTEHYYRHYRKNGKMCTDDRTVYSSLQEAAKEFYK